MTLDGGRPDYLKVSGIPHVDALIRGGTSFSNAFSGILESETPSGHATIASGSNPNRDGILSFAWATANNTPVDLFSPVKIDDHTMENITRQAGAPTIAQLVKAHRPGARVVALSGSKYYAADAFGGPYADVIMYFRTDSHGRFLPTAVPGHVPPAGIMTQPDLSYPTNHLPLGVEDHLAMKLAATTFQRLHQQVTLVNLPEFDWPLGHVDGGPLDPAGVATEMRAFDRDLGMLERVYRQAGVFDQTLFVLTADHGFAPIDHRVDKAVIDGAVASAGTSIVEDNYTTADYLWLADASRANVVAANLARLQNPYIESVYFKSPIPGGYQYIRATGPELLDAPHLEAANQYLLNSFNGPNGPDVAVILREGTSTTPGAQASWKGNHGGADWEAEHIPLVFFGPGVRAGHTSSAPARLMDIAPTALALMGIPDTGMQGTPLAPALQHPTGAQATAASRVEASLMSVVTALKAEARYDLAHGL